MYQLIISLKNWFDDSTFMKDCHFLLSWFRTVKTWLIKQNKMNNVNMRCYKYYEFYHKVFKMIWQFLNIQQKNNNFLKIYYYIIDVTSITSFTMHKTSMIKNVVVLKFSLYELIKRKCWCDYKFYYQSLTK